MSNKNLNITPKLIAYIIKFILRLAAFGTVLWIYICDKQLLFEYTVSPLSEGINFMHVLWLIFMVLMVLHMFPISILSMGAKKSREKYYNSNSCYSQEELNAFVADENKKAWKCMLAWLSGTAVIAFLYYFGIIKAPELILITVFFFVCDYICILIFCPFQTFGQKSRCCVNCRLYDWGHFFMFSPMLFIDTFYSRTLFFMGTAVIIRWEVIWTHHPERFWHGSNKNLSCQNCKDKTCKIKQALKNSICKL